MPVRRRLDPLRLEVFDQLFSAIAEEMGAALGRAALSANIKERRDFSCALFDARGRMLAQAAHIPIHLGSIPACVEAAMRAQPCRPGDTVVLNDPYAGGTHLPDVTLVTPIHVGRSSKPAFYAANRAHHADVGGARPGSMAPAFDVHGEGLRIPPITLARGGVLDRDLLRLLLANVRVPAEREGDLLAQWSANRLAERRVRELVLEQGLAELQVGAEELLEWTARLTRVLIASLPARRVSFTDQLEGGPDGREPIEICVSIERRGKRLRVDFRASADQRPEPINTPRAVALSAVFYVLRLLLPPHTPTNAGVLDSVEVLTRPGSVVDACYPAPVAAGNVETSQRLVDVLCGALAQLLPNRIPAASSGTMSNLSFGGRDARGRAFTYYETLAGGAGASAAGPGAHALHTHMTNTRNTPIEALENELPVRVLELAVRRGSGGRGALRGGEGVTKSLCFLVPVELAWLADRARVGPWGARGGEAGARGRAKVQGVEIASKCSLSVEAGARIELETPGGGGFGRRS